MNEIFTDLYNKVLEFFTKAEEKEDTKNIARNRLKLVLMQDRTNLNPQLLERLRGEMIELLSKYVVIDKDLLELNFTPEDEQLALMLSIPVIRAKNDEEIEEAIKAEDAEKARIAKLLEEAGKDEVSVDDEENCEDEIAEDDDEVEFDDSTDDSDVMDSEYEDSSMDESDSQKEETISAGQKFHSGGKLKKVKKHKIKNNETQNVSNVSDAQNDNNEFQNAEANTENNLENQKEEV